MRSLLFRVVAGLGFTMFVVLCVPAERAYALPQPSFKMEIVAPECTVDAVDDGTGPIQVITCPPGTLPPDGAGSGGAEPSEAGIVISQRLDSSNDALTLRDLLETLQDSGMAVALPDESALFPHPDNGTVESDKKSTSDQQNAFIVTVAVVAATLVVLVAGMYSHAITTAILNIVNRIKLWRKS